MMSIDDLIDGFYEASIEPRHWQDAVRNLGATLRSATGALYLENHADSFSLLSNGVFFGHSAAAVASYGEYYCAKNPFNVAIRHQSGIGVLTDDGFDEKFGHLTSFGGGEYYHDWVRPQNLKHVIGQRIHSVGSSVLCAAFWRPADAGRFTDAEIAGFQTVGRHLNRALDIGGRLAAAEAEMEAVLAKSASAVFTIDRSGTVRHCNSAGDALLDAGTALRRASARLRTAVPEDQMALDRLVACALDPRFANWAENAAVPIRRTDGQPPVIARAIAVAHRFAAFVPDRSATAILTVEGFEAEDRSIEERLRRRIGLSRAEARVARQFHAGRSPAEAATALGLSVETIRTHLKVLFARTDTHRQSELVLRLKAEVDG